MQPELVLHGGKLFIAGVMQRHPDEAVGLVDVVADVLHRDVGEPLSILVNDAVDQHGGVEVGWRNHWGIGSPIQCVCAAELLDGLAGRYTQTSCGTLRRH
jgi:hypothetical protein